MEWQDTLTEARRLLDEARYATRVNRDKLGAASDYIGQVLAMDLVPREAEPAPEEPEPSPETPSWADPRTYMFGFCGRRHHDGSTATDWYPGLRRGQWFGWPWEGVVHTFSVSGPLGPMLVAVDTCVAGPWRDWSVLLNHLLDAYTGYHLPYQPIFQYGDGSLQNFSAMGLDPDHIHVAFDQPGGTSFASDGSGDVLASEALRALGFDVELADWTPGPADYAARRARAGRRI